jgi:hypothetical protein
VEVQLDLFLTSDLDRVEWSTPVALPLRKSPGIHCRGGCMDSRAGLGGNGEVKNSSHRNSNTLTFRSIESCCIDCAVLHRATII